MRRRIRPAAHVRVRCLPGTVAAVLLAGLALGACSSTGGTPGSSATGQYRTGSSGGYALYQSASENRTFVNDAVEELIRRCMVRAGFQYWPMPELPAQYRDPARPLPLADAEQRGYRALDPPTDAPGSAQRQAYLGSLTATQQEQYDRTLSGDPSAKKSVDTAAGRLTFNTGGCTGATYARIVPDPSRYIGLDFQVSNLTSLPEFAPDADPHLIAATHTWAACMSTAGYRYASPGDAIDAATALDTSSSGGDQSTPLGQPAPAATAIAVADATCRASTGWDDANRSAVHNSLAVVVDAHQADILAFNELAASATRKAKEILAR